MGMRMNGWARVVGSFTLHDILHFERYNDNVSRTEGVAKLCHIRFHNVISLHSPNTLLITKLFIIGRLHKISFMCH
jgi:hypothetical protein